MGYLQQRLSYAQVQGASPQTFAYAMMDSPVGQAAWLLEKFQRWTDKAGERTLDDIFGMNRLLTAVMVYPVTDFFDTSIWAYPGLYLDRRPSGPGSVPKCRWAWSSAPTRWCRYLRAPSSSEPTMWCGGPICLRSGTSLPSRGPC